MVKQCPRPLNVAKAATRKMDYYSRKDKGGTYAVHQVLADLCVQLDGSSTSDGEETKGYNDIEVFQTILGNANSESVTVSEITEPEEASNTITNIYVINYEHANVHEVDFLGACIDSAAQKTVVGKPQAELYSQRCGVPFRLEPSNRQPSFRFGTHRHPGLGKIEIRVPISNDHFMLLQVEVVNIDIPFLLGLDTMTAYGMVLDTEGHTLSSKFDGWEISLVRKRGHLYYEWDIQIFFTETELRKIHRHFFHPKAEKLYSLLQRADPDTTSPKVLEDLERIGSTCDPCQRLGTAPHRFKVSLPSGDIVFNREVCIDLMSLNQRTVILAVDRDTKFNVARFLSDETAETAWDTFREMWASTYVGYPDVISADQGPQFRSKYWRSVTKLAGIELKLSGVESHNAINVGETYHEFLRRIFNKTKAENPRLRDKDLLLLATKALNDTGGPNGLVPTLLVFGILPRIPFAPTELPTQTQRMIAMDAARAEMSKLVAESKLKMALKANAPGAASSFEDIKIGSEVLIYREKPIKEWIGPFSVLDVEGKMCQLNVNGKQSNYSIDKVKLYRKPTDQDDSTSDIRPSSRDTPLQISSAKIVDPTDGTLIHTERDPPRQADRGGTEIDHEHPLDAPEVINRWKESISELQNQELQRDTDDLQDLRLDDPLPDGLFADDTASIHMTKVLPPNDPRSESPEFDGAKSEEAEGIKKRDIWEIVPRAEVPSDANLLGGRFVLAYKNHGTSSESVKARYVAQGHKDKEKGFVVHNVTTMRASSVRILVSVAAVKGFRIYADDVRQAYLQNEHPLTRDIYLLPKPKDRKFFDLGDNQILKLKKPIYGVPDAGDYWDVTIHEHVKEDLNLIPLTGDPALYRKPNDEDLDGLMAVYVDDKAMTGNKNMQELTEKTAKRFESKPREWDEFNFFGMHLKTIEKGSFSIDQVNYIRKLKPLPMDCSFEQFRSYRAIFAWIGLTRPDLAFAINRAAQVSEKTFSVEKVKELNKGIVDAKDSCNRRMLYQILFKKSLHLRLYTDASFAKNDDLSTQIGFVILLCDARNACHILDFASRKCKRVVRSVLGGEVYALADGFDRAYMLKRDLESIYKTKIPLHMLTDSKLMFDVLTKSSTTTERRLMIDLRALQEAYKKEEISHVGLVSSAPNVADAFTKCKPNLALLDIMHSGFDHTPIEQWIFRTKTSSL